MNRHITVIKTVRDNATSITHESFGIELSVGINISFSTRIEDGSQIYSILFYDSELDMFIYEFLDVTVEVFNKMAELADNDNKEDINNLIESHNLNNELDY